MLWKYIRDNKKEEEPDHGKDESQIEEIYENVKYFKSKFTSFDVGKPCASKEAAELTFKDKSKGVKNESVNGEKMSFKGRSIYNSRLH